MMERPPTPRQPAESRYAFDLDDVEPRRDAPRPTDLAGLTPEDRRALGLVTPRIVHHVPDVQGDAATALRDLLAKGGALGRDARRGKK